MRALGKNVLVENIEEEQTSQSGLILTGSASDSLFQKATVVSVGSLVEQVGETDVIYFMKNQGVDLSGSGFKFTVVREEHIVSRVGE